MTVSQVVLAVWVLAVAQVVASKVVAEGVAAVVGSDVAAERRGSGFERRVWEHCCGAVGRLGSERRRFRGVWGWLGAGEGAEVVVVDDVGDGDGGCADVVSGDVAVSLAFPWLVVGG